MKLKKIVVLSLKVVSFGIFFLVADTLLAASFTQDVGAIQINWSSERFRSFGVATIQEKSSEAIAKAEKEAMDKAYSNVKDNLDALSDALGIVSSKVDFSSFKPSIYLAKTEYYDFDSVKVIVEARMSRLFKGVVFLDPSKRFSESKNSGVIFSVDSGVKPASLYTIYNEEGQPVFSSVNVYAQAFDTSAMGKWFKGRAGNFGEIEKIVGKTPVTIKVKSQGGRMVVTSSEWQAAISGNEGLVADCKVALIVE